MRQLDYNWEFNVLNIENYRLQNKLTRYFDFIIENHDRLGGDIFEFGVYKGRSLLLVAMLLKELGSDKLSWVMLLQPPAYMRNGAIYLSKRDVVIHDNSLWGKSIYPLVMDEESSVNIDSMLDFEMAELLMKKRQA